MSYSMNNRMIIAYVQYIIFWVKKILGLPKTQKFYGNGAVIIGCRIEE